MKTTENVRQKAGYSFFAAISAKVSSNIRLGISFALVSAGRTLHLSLCVIKKERSDDRNEAFEEHYI
jgi:hypothetical protein